MIKEDGGHCHTNEKVDKLPASAVPVRFEFGSKKTKRRKVRNVLREPRNTTEFDFMAHVAASPEWEQEIMENIVLNGTVFIIAQQSQDDALQTGS